jgi:nucleotide-binding universal stress UspA family protein
MKSKRPRRILVPIDFSDESINTLRMAKLLAARFRAQLDLLHVMAPSPPSFPPQGPLLPNVTSSSRIARATLDRLEDFAFEQSVQPLSYSCTIRIGSAADEINKAARKSRANLIAIATRGYSGLKYAFLGSTTAQVVRSAPCPVLVVRDLEHLSGQERARRGRTPLQFQKILVPLDFSECSRVGLNCALGLALEFGSSLLLFHCVVPPAYALGAGHTALAGPKLIASQQEFAQDEMENLHRELGKQSVDIEMLVATGSPVEQINACIRKQGVDVIVTSTHGRTGLKRLFIGSTAEQIVRYAICPVLVVPNRPSQKKPRKQPC